MSISLQVAIKRAQFVAKRSFARAVQILRAAGVAFESAFAAAARYASFA